MRRVFRLPDSHARARRALDDELRFHLEGRIEELVASGLSRTDADAEARRRFGDFESHRTATLAIDDQIIQEHRRMDTLRQRHSRAPPRRTLARPAAAASPSPAVITLALGSARRRRSSRCSMPSCFVHCPTPTPTGSSSCSSPVPKFKGDTLWGVARHEAFYFHAEQPRHRGHRRLPERRGHRGR